MDYAIHLTDRCNLNCKYCYESGLKQDRCISFDDIKKVIDYEMKNKASKKSTITFYGGEPLLKKDLIEDTIKYVKEKRATKHFRYNITTNGLLLDDDFLKFMKENNFINISYSIDGTRESHNSNRVTYDGSGSFDIVYENAKKVLNSYANADAMCVVTKSNLTYLGKNVESLRNMGFNYINTLIDYTYKWCDEDIKEIKKQFRIVADIYKNEMLNEREIHIPIFDEKIKSYIDDRYSCNDGCILGMKNIHVGTDGNFYPCSQFVYRKDFVIGNVDDGIDNELRNSIAEQGKAQMNLCDNCKINRRCKHTCACKNYMINKSIDKLSPLVCEVERILVDIADDIIEELHEKKSKIFKKLYY